MSQQLPGRAAAVVIGGGVAGTSVAYHLAGRGWRDVVLLEQGELSCGTTWHAAGLIGQLRTTETLTRLVQYSAELYSRLEAEVGLATGYERCGGLIVARTEQRMEQLRRTAATGRLLAMECELLTPAQALARYPLLRVDDLVGALWLPGDGTANPTDLTRALAAGARRRGARVVEHTRVRGISTAGGAVTGVHTDRGDILAPVVVNCAGQWAKQLADTVGVTVPLHSAEHFYVVTRPVPGVHRGLPILRDPDGYTYVKREVDGLVIGAFEPNARPWVDPGDIPYPFEFRLLGEDWDHFAPMLANAVHRIPALADVGIRKFYDGPESFTPDNNFVLGEAPELSGFFVCAGFNSVGIASAGGAGRLLADWIVDGRPAADLVGLDIRRFAPFQGNSRYLRERVGEVLGHHYEVPWPTYELRSARPLRRSPVFHVLAAAGARFGSKAGWERALYFVTPGADGGDRFDGGADGGSDGAGGPDGGSDGAGYTWGKPRWLAHVAAEHRNTRSNVTVFDQTSFAKLLVTGADAEVALQWLCTADVGKPPGSVTYTGMLNAHGTYEADVTVTRVSPTEFLVLSSTAAGGHDADHIRRSAPRGLHFSVVDVTSASAVFGVMGPRSRDLLARLTRTDLSAGAFPFGASRQIFLGRSPVRATRITYVGELGWELHVPAEFAVTVFAELQAAGAPFGLRNGGYYAIESLRLERGYRAFGPDLAPDIGPVAAGLTFACKLDTPIPFLGRAAVERERDRGLTRRLVWFAVADPDAMLWGGEPLLRDGAIAGRVTSVAWAATAGRCVGLASCWSGGADPVTRGWLAAGSYRADVGGRAIPVRVSLRPPSPAQLAGSADPTAAGSARAAGMRS